MQRRAIDVLEAELEARGVTEAEVEEHAAFRKKTGLLRRPDGTVASCKYCPRPASGLHWRWFKLWGWFLPLFPRWIYLCKEHQEQLPADVHGRTLHYDTGPESRREDPEGENPSKVPVVE
jgi:hypothetical protein